MKTVDKKKPKKSPEKNTEKKSENAILKEENIRLKAKIRQICAVLLDTGFSLQLLSKQFAEK